jgi:hypothetical protein
VFGDVPNLSVEPIPGAIVSLPFIYSSVGIVVADDGARESLRRSARLARQRKRLALALAAFALLSGVLEGLALGSGLDLIVRLTEVLHLDVAAGGASLALAMVLGLLIATAVGSLVFTVSALVSAPQIVAWDRLGLPTTGLPAAEAAEAAALVVEADATDAAAPQAGVTGVELNGAEAPAAAATDPGATGTAAIDDATRGTEETTPAESGAPASIPEPQPASAWGAPPVPAPGAWAIAAATPPRFRWVTVPMRLTISALWLIAIAMFIGGPPV